MANGARLEREERALLQAVDRGEWQPVERPSAERGRYRAYAAATLRKDRRVNIRIARQVLDAIQERAIEEGMPYQTLIASLLHKYVSGRLVERPR